MKLKHFAVGAVLAVFTVVSATADKLGDAAAPLVIKDWVKGKPVDIKDGKQIYVVEFWATWCGPCKRSIPHLTELQKKFKDQGVVFVGISDEPLDKVKPYVEKLGAEMGYTVACDDERKSNAGYMRAYGQNGIPHAFVVGKKGKVIWHGHPMVGLEDALAEIVAGKYDLQAAVKKDATRAALDEYEQLSAKGDAKAGEAGRKLLADQSGDFNALCDFAFNIAANARNKNRDFALADEALQAAEKLAEGKNHRVLGIRAIVRFESGKEQEGLALAKEALKLSTDDKDRARYQSFVRVMESRLAKEKTDLEKK